jgi:hypothetical protein
MKITQIKWTQENCIKCGLVIIAILLALYLFRHYTIIEGFDLGTSSLSNVSLPSLSSSSSSSLSKFGSIGPIPAGTKWSDQTIKEFKVLYKSFTKTDIKDSDLELYMTYATEDDAKYYIKNKKWEWPQYYIDCMMETTKEDKTLSSQSSGKPAPTPEEIKADVDKGLENIQPFWPIRLAVTLRPEMFGKCIESLKETEFMNKILAGSVKDRIPVGENKTLGCQMIGVDSKSAGGGVTRTYHTALAVTTLDPATTKTTDEEIGFDKIKSFISGFNFLNGGKTTKGEEVNCQNFRQAEFEVDNKGVSPFYQALWGIPASNSTSLSTNSQPATISSSEESTAVLRQIKKKLDSMPTI